MSAPTRDRAITVLAVGDVLIDRPDPVGAFDHVRAILAAGDVVFGNCEAVYAERCERAPSAGVAVVVEPRNAEALGPAGFDVMSLANNHVLDGGHAALLETIERLEAQGIACAGAGEQLDAARRPALLELDGGPTVALLAYTSTFPHGYEARRAVPGVAPLRAYTLCTPFEENEWNPGMLPRVWTTPHAEDLAAFREDVRRARERADVVLVSMHWGDFTRPFALTDHERRMGRIAIEAGADAVLGHHHHVLRGFEHHDGKPVLYGLGHFVFDLPDFAARLAAQGYLGQTTDAARDAARRRFGAFQLGPREGYPLLPFHPYARLTAIAVLRIAGGTLEAGVIPCRIEPDGRPRPLDPGAQDGRELLEFLRRCCAEERLPATLEPDAGWRVGGHPVVRVEAA